MTKEKIKEEVNDIEFHLNNFFAPTNRMVLSRNDSEFLIKNLKQQMVENAVLESENQILKKRFEKAIKFMGDHSGTIARPKILTSYGLHELYEILTGDKDESNATNI